MVRGKVVTELDSPLGNILAAAWERIVGLPTGYARGDRAAGRTKENT
jgi:hypothetical protein